MTKMGVLCLLAEGSRCPSLSCSLINSSKVVNFGSIMGHCSTLMSLSKNKERALRSGTRFPENSGQAVAFRIGGVPLGQCASVREERPERPSMSWVMISSKEAQSLVRTTPISSSISHPQRLHGISATLEKRNLGCHLCPSSVPGGPQYGVLLSSHFTDGGDGSKDFQ